MINHINGRLIEKSPTHVVIEAAGVGYYINISLNTFSKVGNDEACKLFTHLAVKEDSHTLYGFFEVAEREVFRKLISVSGVGASTARMMLSSLSPTEIAVAITGSDIATLKGVKGIGGKTAERIILDLRDKISKDGAFESLEIPVQNTAQTEALSALLALGFKKDSAEKVLRKILVKQSDLSVEGLVKEALKQL
ncbi:MAG: Holliday junction DNA helicase RuvA [Saprospiraceae bacterium]|jgi:Holliday junction DNA helicase RuvA